MRRRADLVIDEDEETAFLSGSRKTRRSIHSVPTAVSFGFIAVMLGLYGLVYIVDNALPTPLYLSDEKEHPDAFITERARHDLKLMTDLGPRIAGAYTNEILTFELLKREISFIMQGAHKNQKLELNTQVAAGSHYYSMTPHGKFVSYSNVQNIVVKLHAENNVTQAVLVNAHFDTFPNSPGGSDDAINCVVMLEVLRKLSRRPQRPLNNVIFLFNGAEETGLQAAHGFITKHKWAKECKVVVNLEAAGVGGKIILFQTGPSAAWLMDYYKKVPHPYGQVGGEEIFQSNLVPSDTDFRIFRDYGGLVGYDMAFFKNGWRYHTKYDDFDHIPLGSLQHVGDNALSLVGDLANAPEVANPKENPGKVIFFDFLGFFMVTYSQAVARVLNYVTVLLSLGIIIYSVHIFKLGYTRQTVKYLALTLGAITGGWIVAAVFVVVVALIIDKIGFTMSWYSNPWLVFGLYVAPTLVCSALLFPYVSNEHITYNVKSQIQAHSVRLIWTVILLIGTMLNIRTMYAFLIPILFNSVAFVVIYLWRWQHTIRKWQITYVISLMIPTVFLMYESVIVLSLFVPITGRIGPDKNAELIVGTLTFFFTILITSPFVALATLVRNIKFPMIFLGVLFVGSFVTIFTPLGFPYSGNKDSAAPERYWILHTRRIFHNEDGVEIKRDAGYFVLDMDRNSPGILRSYVKDLDRARSLEDDCKVYLLCGLPLAHAMMIQIIPYSTWVPAGQPLIPESTKLEVLSKFQVSPTVLRYNVSVTGPDRMGLYFSPKKGGKVLSISLVDKMPPKGETTIWNDRELYFILHIYGVSAAPLTFSFDVEVPTNSSEVTTEVAVFGIHVHDDKNRKVPHYVQFLNAFPEWADVTAWLGSYESWWI